MLCSFLQINGATMLNLSLLTSDMWSVLIRIFAYHEKVSCNISIYFVAPDNPLLNVNIMLNILTSPELIILSRLIGCTLWLLVLLLLALLSTLGMCFVFPLQRISVSCMLFLLGFSEIERLQLCHLVLTSKD